MSTLGRRKGRKRSLEAEDRSDAEAASKLPRLQSNPMPRLLPFEGINQGRMAALQSAIDDGLVDDNGWVEGREPANRQDEQDATSRGRRSGTPSISPTKLAELQARLAQAAVAELPRTIQPRPSVSAQGRQFQLRPSAERAIQPRSSAFAEAPQRHGQYYQDIIAQGPPARNRPLGALPAQESRAPRFQGYFNHGTQNAAVGNLPPGFDPTRPQIYYILPNNAAPTGQQQAAPPLRRLGQYERPIQIDDDDDEVVEPPVARGYAGQAVHDPTDPGDEDLIEMDVDEPTFGDPEAPSYPETQDPPEVDDHEYAQAPVYQNHLETHEAFELASHAYPPAQPQYQYTASTAYYNPPVPAYHQSSYAGPYDHSIVPAYYQYRCGPHDHPAVPAYSQYPPVPAGYRLPQADYQPAPTPIRDNQGDEAVEMTVEQMREAGRWYVPDKNRTAMIQEYFQMYPITDIEATMEAYFQKYGKDLQPFDFGDDTDDKLLMCLCLKPDDGRDYIECCNGVKCMKQFFHPGCLGMSLFDIPRQDLDEWYCPPCVKEGLGGALEVKKRRTRVLNKRRPLVRRASTGCVVDKMQALAVDRPLSMETKPWSADLDEKFAANPDNIRDLNIETLPAAKAALQARAAEPLRLTRQRPMASVGTIVKQPNKNTWTDREDSILIEIMEELDVDGLSGEPLWKAVEAMMPSRGLNRNIGGARNRWMRGLREATQIDERRKKNARKLTTSVQVPNHLRDPNSPRAKKKPFTTPRKANGPSTAALVSSPLRHDITADLSSPTPASRSSLVRQRPAVSTPSDSSYAPSPSPRRPRVAANTSRGVPAAGPSPLRPGLRSGSSFGRRQMLPTNAPYDPDRPKKDDDVKMQDYDDESDDVRSRLPRKRLGPD